MYNFYNCYIVTVISEAQTSQEYNYRRLFFMGPTSNKTKETKQIEYREKEKLLYHQPSQRKISKVHVRLLARLLVSHQTSSPRGRESSQQQTYYLTQRTVDAITVGCGLLSYSIMKNRPYVDRAVVD